MTAFQQDKKQDNEFFTQASLKPLQVDAVQQPYLKQTVQAGNLASQLGLPFLEEDPSVRPPIWML